MRGSVAGVTHVLNFGYILVCRIVNDGGDLYL